MKPPREDLRSFTVKDKMEREKIDRINELGRLAKERELTEEELAERKALRDEYIAYFRAEIRKDVDKK